MNPKEALDRILTEARSAWDVDGAPLIACQEDGFEQEAAEKFAVSLERSFAVGWDLILEPADCEELSAFDRVANAPLYVSAKHPWPSEQGLYAIPIVQLDLEWVAERAGCDLGSVQLWHGERDMRARVIPMADLIETSEAIPEFVQGVNLASYHFDLEDTPRPSFLSNCHRIVDVAGPYIFGAMAHDERLEGYIASPRASAPLRKAFSALWKEVKSGRESYEQVTRLLGSFDGIQASPKDHPPTLFSSDDDTICNTGDAGVISLHFDRSDHRGVTFVGNFECC